LTTSNAVALYFKEEFELSTPASAAVGSVFGFMNLFCRGLGGFCSDVSNAYRGMRGRLFWQHLVLLFEGIMIIIFSRAQTLGGAVASLSAFSLFVQAAEGSTFGIVPYLNPNLTGTVAGIIGAGGNAGAVIFSFIFRETDYRTAFYYMGLTTTCISLLSNFVWIKGYEGLFLKRRIQPSQQ
jgi:NNP family nitrate/nitrite transporter-like MFS transporter